MQLALFARVVMRDRHLPQLAVLVGDIDDAKIGQPRNDEAREILKRLLVIERAGEDVARFGEKREPLLPRFRFLRARPARG